MEIGYTFCNRKKEKAAIKRNIRGNRHTLIVSPRRYGKTSLVYQTLQEMKIPAAYVQFFNAFQGELLINRLTHGLSKCLSQLMPVSQKALKTLQGLLKHTRLSASYMDAEVSF